MQRNRRNKSKPLPPKQPLQGRAYQSLTKALRSRADELGLSVRALARRLDKPSTTVHKTLWGQRRMDPIEFIDWCEALELSDPVAFIKMARHP